MVRESRLILTVGGIQETSRATERAGRAFINGLTARNTTALGKPISNMEKLFIPTPTGRKSGDFGRMASANIG